MGVLFSRLKRGKQNSKEILEGLESEIQKLSHRESLNSQHEKSFVCYLLTLSFFIYLIAAVIFYCYFVPTTWVDSVNVVPLVLFPVVIYGIKKLLRMYFAHMQQKYAAMLKELRDEKKKVLDSIMEKEVYKVAVQLLERFDPSNPALKKTQEPIREDVRHRRVQKREPDPQQRPHPHPAYQVVVGTPNVTAILQTPRPQPPAPGMVPHPPAPGMVPQTPAMSESFIPPGMCLGPAPGPPQPNPILPRDRSTLDKMVDYLVGDGPSNRYALICSQCSSHNGMALKDDFEYTAFRCAYCFTFNAARKKKPLQPSQMLSPGPRAATPPVPVPTPLPVTPLTTSREKGQHEASTQDVDHAYEQEVDHASKEEQDETTEHVPRELQSEQADRPPSETPSNET